MRSPVLTVAPAGPRWWIATQPRRSARGAFTVVLAALVLAGGGSVGGCSLPPPPPNGAATPAGGGTDPGWDLVEQAPRRSVPGEEAVTARPKPHVHTAPSAALLPFGVFLRAGDALVELPRTPYDTAVGGYDPYDAVVVQAGSPQGMVLHLPGLDRLIPTLTRALWESRAGRMRWFFGEEVDVLVVPTGERVYELRPRYALPSGIYLVSVRDRGPGHFFAAGTPPRDLPLLDGWRVLGRERFVPRAGRLDLNGPHHPPTVGRMLPGDVDAVWQVLLRSLEDLGETSTQADRARGTVWTHFRAATARQRQVPGERRHRYYVRVIPAGSRHTQVNVTRYVEWGHPPDEYAEPFRQYRPVGETRLLDRVGAVLEGR